MIRNSCKDSSRTGVNTDNFPIFSCLFDLLLIWLLFCFQSIFSSNQLFIKINTCVIVFFFFVTGNHYNWLKKFKDETTFTGSAN